MKQLQDSSLSSVEKSFDENSSQELSLESLSEISGGTTSRNSSSYNYGTFLSDYYGMHYSTIRNTRVKSNPEDFWWLDKWEAMANPTGKPEHNLGWNHNRKP